MRNILISSILALAVIGFSGCGAKAASKGASCVKPVLPSCVPNCKKTPVPCPTPCKKTSVPCPCD